MPSAFDALAESVCRFVLDLVLVVLSVWLSKEELKLREYFIKAAFAVNDLPYSSEPNRRFVDCLTVIVTYKRPEVIRELYE